MAAKQKPILYNGMGQPYLALFNFGGMPIMNPITSMIGEGINSLARKTLTITLFFIGASLSRDVLKAVGIKPLIQGTLLWIVISVSTLAYIYLF